MTCRCVMCGVKNSKTNRNSLYRYIGTSEFLNPKDKKMISRQLRHSQKINRLINAERDSY